jgi:choline dehydrogenase-like flavoprotein
MTDPDFRLWKEGKGLYTSNGGLVGIIKRSDKSKPDPDLYIFGLAGYFKGYVPGYSHRHLMDKDYLTWAVLKGHTQNRGGQVLLRSNSPLDTPEINFHYFDDKGSSSKWQEDVDAVLNGVKFVRRMNEDPDLKEIIESEEQPGALKATDDELREFIKNEAWGHHASCSCKIGSDNDEMAVLDSNFRVRGVGRLRVVDACVFPFIPGLFVVSAVYMIAEKAADVIIHAHKQEGKK